jgi:phenylacetate-CoA ligase
LDDLKKLRPLEKSDLREHGDGALLSVTRERNGSFFSSSGSTGTPTRILFSALMHQRYAAAHEARCRNWAGVERFDPRGMIGGRRVVKQGLATPPFYRYNFVEKQVYFSAYHISPENAKDYLRGIERYGLSYMTGYASSNYFLARFFSELNLQPPPMKAVITSSEKLEPYMRETFRKVYGCKSYDGWSGVEACGMVTENEYGQLLVSPDVGIIELIKSDGSYCEPGETGEVYCTGLLNFDQPLIRYKIGDLFRLAKNQVTTCGRSFQVIDEIVGRIENIVIGKDGREMVRFHGIFVELPNLIEGQIIQHTLTSFEIKIVTNGRWTSIEEEMIRKRMKSQLGDIGLRINRVSKIPRNENGKFQAVISHVKRGA